MSVHELVDSAMKQFRDKFNCEPEVAVFAPGRVNLIGEHVDYNDGFVLPFALPFRTVMVGSRAAAAVSTVVTASMLDVDGTASFEISGGLCRGAPDWANYVKGTIFQYLEDLPAGAAINASIASDVPLGSGLSSSASLEVCTATFLEYLYDLRVPSVTKALRCQKAEHTFAGMPCGIMDQYVSAMGAEGMLLLIDCRSNESQLIPFGDGEAAAQYRLVVTNSNVKHRLSDSEYPLRVQQCRDAVQAVRRVRAEVSALRDVDMALLESCKSGMSEVAYRRARHCVGEDARTLGAVRALSECDFSAVGRLMTDSHASLRDDYEVSCPELDVLVEIANSVPGVLGSRMTGGGFGGCTITLVKADAVPLLIERLCEGYRSETGKECVSYVVVPSAGAGVCS